MWLEDALACTNVLLVVEERPAGHAHLFMTAKAKHLKSRVGRQCCVKKACSPIFSGDLACLANGEISASDAGGALTICMPVI